VNVTITGVCLSGEYSKVVVSARDGCTLYAHEDSRRPQRLSLHVHNIFVENHLVALGTTPRVHVVEHLFSALYGLDLFNVQIDFHGNEVPFFDGSSSPFVAALVNLTTDLSPDTVGLPKEIVIRERDSFIRYTPVRADELIIDMGLSHPYIETQKCAVVINRENYIHEIAPARTFVFTEEHDPRLKNLPPYGIGITKRKMYSSTPLRFSNELVRHKILDLLGDLFIIGRKLTGKIIGKNTSHRLNQKFIKRILFENKVVV
jgi:UDP-3-O-[3-hydroxymyristoyl] N-acetylglucosamine deacetylase